MREDYDAVKEDYKLLKEDYEEVRAENADLHKMNAALQAKYDVQESDLQHTLDGIRAEHDNECRVLKEELEEALAIADADAKARVDIAEADSRRSPNLEMCEKVIGGPMWK